MLQIDAAMYGLIRAIFAFEHGRDAKIAARLGFTRISKSVWKFEHEGHTAYLVIYVDDYLAVGHAIAVQQVFKA